MLPLTDTPSRFARVAALVAVPVAVALALAVSFFSAELDVDAARSAILAASPAGPAALAPTTALDRIAAGLPTAAGVLVNLALLVLAAATALPVLRERGSRRRVVELLVVFVVASPLPRLIALPGADAWRAAASLAGLSLALAALGGSGPARPYDRLRALGGGLLLGGLGADLLPAVALAAAPFARATNRRRREVAMLLVGLVVGAVAVLAWSTTRVPPAGVDLADGGAIVLRHPRAAWADEAPAPGGFGVDVRLHTLLDLLAGRELGLVPHFASLLALAWTWRRSSRSPAAEPQPNRHGRTALLVAAAAAALAAPLLQPFAADGTPRLGGRWAVAAAPAVLLAVPRLPGTGALALAAAIAAAVDGSTVAARLAGDGEILAPAGLLRWLPRETTLTSALGERQAVIAADRVRAPVTLFDGEGIRIPAGAAVEIVVATAAPEAPIRALVTSPADGLTLHLRDWAGESTVAIPGGRVPTYRFVALTPKRGWRLHPLADEPTPHSVRVFTIEARDTTGRPAPATIRFLGTGLDDRAALAYQRLGVAIPPTVTAGSRFRAGLSLRNQGSLTWRSSGEVWFSFGWRLVDAAGAVVTEGRALLPKPVPPDATLTERFPIDLPPSVAPGRYRLELDLLIEKAAWLGDVHGAPIAAVDVTVTNRR